MTSPDATRADRVALVTGVTGQDGGYLVELLLAKGYQVHGVSRHASGFDFSRLSPASVRGHLRLHDLDICGSDFIQLMRAIEPDEIYHLASQSHVPTSLENPLATFQVNVEATQALLQALHALPRAAAIRLFNAASAQIFGASADGLVDEASPKRADNPYAASKLAAYEAVVEARRRGLFAANGLLFNHESPYRGAGFVTRKISQAVARRSRGEPTLLRLGALDVRRDWSHARDIVEGMWRILQQPAPDDFILASGVSHSVRDFVECAFGLIGARIVWEGSGPDETGHDAASGEVLVSIDPAFYRPREAAIICGNSAKAQRILGWRSSYPFEKLVEDMVSFDIAQA